MIDAIEIKVTRKETSGLKDVVLENAPFGRHFCDHMLVAQYDNGAWQTPEIMPYGPMAISPANAALHYGQSIFEGIKAFRMASGSIAIFRPHDNWHRFNRSAERMEMPAVPEEIFIEGMRKLIALDADWVPGNLDHSLYIRPFMFAADPFIGVRASLTYTFVILISPTGPYFSQPMRIFIEDQFVRAAQGGVGYAKTAGNYAAAMYPTNLARKRGFDQVLWTDATEHKYIEEIGVMNVFFVVGNQLWTPSLDSGTILHGVTRDSVITIAREMGMEIREDRISLDELVGAYKQGELKEVFGAGTAAIISPIKELVGTDINMVFDVAGWLVSPAIKSRLNDIRYGMAEDTHGWMLPVA